MTLYEKIGRRYLPVQDTTAMEGLYNGSWLITVRDGRTTCRKVLDAEAGLELLAACEHLADWIAEALAEHAQCQPRGPLTSLERQAWEAWCAVMGKEGTLTLEQPSVREIAERVAASVRKRIDSGK